jgi:WD40 repeat protein
LWLALATSGETEEPSDVWLWNLTTKRATRIPVDIGYGIGMAQSRHMQFSPDSKTLAVASLDKSVHLITLETMQTKRIEVGVEAEVLAFSPDGTKLAVGGTEGALMLWDVTSGALTSSKPQNNTGLVDLVFSPDGAMVAASLRGDTLTDSLAASEIIVWELSSGALRHLRGHTLPAVGLTFSRESDQLFSCGVDHTVQRWSLADNSNTKLFTPGQCNWLALSPDGETVAVSGAFSSLMLWEWRTKQQRLLRGHLIATSEVHFSKDGDTLLSASPDATLRLWDLATQESRIIGRHRDQISLAAFSPDEEMIASASIDGEVRLWPDLLPHEPAALRAWLRENAPTKEDLKSGEQD